MRIFLLVILLNTALTNIPNILRAEEIKWDDLSALSQNERLFLQEKIIFPEVLIAPRSEALFDSFEYLFYGAYLAVFNLKDCQNPNLVTELDLYQSRLFHYEFGAFLGSECRLHLYITRAELQRPALFQK